MIKLKQFQIYTQLSYTKLSIKGNRIVHYKTNDPLSLWINSSDKWYPGRKKFLIRLRNRFGD